MPEKLPPPCPNCGADNPQRNGTHPKTGAQKLHCQECGAHFRATYQRQGWREGSDRQIARRLYEGASVRAVARALHLSPTTVQQRRQSLRKEFLALLQGHAERQSLFESKTPLRYPGGKAKVLDILLPWIPTDIREYREPFLGGGSMFLAARSLFGATLQRTWINDLQPDLAHFWQVLQQNAGELVQAILALRGQHAEGKALYRHLLWNFDAPDPLARAARAFILNRITFSGVIEAGGYSENAFQQRFTDSAIQKLPALTRLLHGADITCGSYAPLLHAPGQDVFLYLDPPYLSATPSKLYGQNGHLHTAFDHVAFAQHARTSPHRWLITYDDSPEIRRLFAFARLQEFHCQYGMNNYQQATARKGRELIITNF